jgi:predicted RNA-binding Zn ribbon-like protein
MRTFRLQVVVVEAAQLVQTQLLPSAVTAAQEFRTHTAEVQPSTVAVVVVVRELTQTVLQEQVVLVAAETAEDKQVEVQELQIQAAAVVELVAKMLEVQVVLAS